MGSSRNRFLKAVFSCFFEEVLSEKYSEITTTEDWLVCFGLAGLPIQPLLDLLDS
ncbi:hypothetical protein [Capnocytophaga periodontitidis]|uniref:hypothetical protein n=1 Tax=Capnocytophaga periodontitidis TaxID=2795027 RepID=UPI001CED5317|nr:hypothetical protein [Capnocytophaga periodontitidis]